MRTLARIISALALIGTLVPACVYLAGHMNLDQVKSWMLVSTVVWFLSVPVWMDRKDDTQ